MSEDARALCSQFFVESGASGLSVSIRYKRSTLLCEAWGEADRASAMPATPATAFLAGSITKQLVAAAALLACDDAHISIDAPVAGLIDAQGAIDPRTTVRHLLSHTSGLRTGLEFDLLGDPKYVLTLPSVVQTIKAEASQLTPGTSWFYSNVGYFIVGHAIERLAGFDLSTFVRSRLLDRTQMKHSTVGNGATSVLERAVGHRLGASGYETIQPPSHGASFGSGSLYCSPTDLTLWAESLWLANRLGTRIPREMSTPFALNDGRTTGYGLGTYVTRLGDYLELSHDGHSGGFSAQLAVYRDAELVVCVMLNSDRHIAEQLEKTLSRRVLGLAMRPAIERHVQSMEAYVGEYLYGAAQIPVAQYEGGLMIRTPGGRVVDLIPVGLGKFVESDDANTVYRFEAAFGGRRVHISRFSKHLATLVQKPTEV